MAQQTYDILNKAWKSACRVVMGGEVGELKDYEQYLAKCLEPINSKKSALSGKEVSVSSQNFCPDAKFISNEEREQYDDVLKNAKLSINDIKDTDSIISALSEKLYYCGNIITGNSHEVSKSDSCANSSFIYCCSEVYDSKYMAFAHAIRYSEHLYGCVVGSESDFLIKCSEVFRQSRCFEALRCYACADCYYCAACEDSQNCMFSFNQRSKSHRIGNVQLERGKYAGLKAKLLEELRGELKANKTAPSVMEIIRG